VEVATGSEKTSSLFRIFGKTGMNKGRLGAFNAQCCTIASIRNIQEVMISPNSQNAIIETNQVVVSMGEFSEIKESCIKKTQ
jgi:K+/H+ antiporter YhaU regulatory subunit KhtT